MMKSLGYLFDLDGTLLDTAPEFAHCLNVMLRELHEPPIDALPLKPHVSKGAKGMCTFAFGHLRIDIEPLIKRFLDIYESALGHNSLLFPGVADTLSQLNNQAIPWGIVTNKHTRFTLPLVAQFPALARAQVIVSGDTTSPKPAAEPLLLAAKKLNNPTTCWYVGDARTDVEASRAAHFPCAIANYGYLPQDDDPQTWGAECSIDHFSDILTIGEITATKVKPF